MKQEKYLKFIADKNYFQFYKQGYATAGNNGPHGHKDTPVRNTSHYLIIYSYLYKISNEKKYYEICLKFAEYLYNEQKKSKSGAIKCMESNKFDYLNGLIGQAWVIEALIYFYEVSKNKKYLESAKSIFQSQKYDFDLHLWRRIELDGTDIGIDSTYNHHVWFAACSYKLLYYFNDLNMNNIIEDFINNGTQRDFKIYNDGLLKHNVNIKNKAMNQLIFKNLIKLILTPINFINPRKFDIKYIEYAYHIFDIYGFCILSEQYYYLPFFSSQKYLKSVELAKNVEKYNSNNRIDKSLKNNGAFNVFGYSYNSPAFEFPFIAFTFDVIDETIFEYLYQLQVKLMYDNKSSMFILNNPDIETWNAKTYEIIRYLDKRNNYLNF